MNAIMLPQRWGRACRCRNPINRCRSCRRSEHYPWWLSVRCRISAFIWKFRHALMFEADCRRNRHAICRMFSHRRTLFRHQSPIFPFDGVRLHYCATARILRTHRESKKNVDATASYDTVLTHPQLGRPLTLFSFISLSFFGLVSNQ